MLLFHLASLVALSAAQGPAVPGYAWRGYGGDPYHDAISTVQSAPLNRVLWKASLDDDRSYYGDVVFMHYSSPCISAANTIVHSFRFTTEVGGSPDYDNWRVMGRLGKTGAMIWSLSTDYSAPVVYPSDWTSVYPLSLIGKNSVAAGGGGGTVLIRSSADTAAGSITRIVPYTSVANYNASPSTYSSIKICTPFMSDSNGNLWYGYIVESPLPGALGAQLGTGGVVRVSSTGETTYRSVESLGVDPSLNQPALNAAPALSRDGNSVYFAVRESSYYSPAYLVKLNAMNLETENSVQVIDPSLPGTGALEINESSAAPMVAPDGHVFYGVFGYYWRESHGWMLQFDENLNQNDSHGIRYPVGAFGWDDTPSIVPSNLVASYKGSAPYLILTKYNDYAINTTTAAHGVGRNKVAILDPTSNTTSIDWQTGIPVMNEILLVVGVTPDQGSISQGYQNPVCEWCINSAAIDPFLKVAIINSEDGHCYKWSFATNSLTQGINLAPPTSEAYTSTVIGPDGTCYAINNSVLWAIGK